MISLCGFDLHPLMNGDGEHFLYTVGYLHVFFSEKSIQVLCTILNQVIGVFGAIVLFKFLLH